MADDEREEKVLKDFTALVNQQLPDILKQAKQNNKNIPAALDQLLALEKKTRLAADVNSTKTIALAIIQLLFDMQQWKLLNDHIQLLCKRRAQLKKVVISVIQTATAYVDKVPTDAIKLDLLATLRIVSEGKLFVELERARLTRTLAEMQEKDGNVSKAADTIQEIQVETVGAMELREKADFLLSQIRLCLLKQDFVRAEIISNKVNPKLLETEDMQDIKLKYYNLMIRFYRHSAKYLSICKAFYSIFHTPNVQADPAQWSQALKNTVIFLTLSPFDAEVSDLLHRVKAEKKLQDLPREKLVLEQFTTEELMRWPLSSVAEWKLDPVFSEEGGDKRLQDLHKRVVQHNIRVVSHYYTRITTKRLAQLLQLTEDESEEYLSELVSSKQLWAKIDRPTGIISFAKKATPDSTIDTWSADINELLELVEKTSHLIDKENLVHNIQSASEQSAAAAGAAAESMDTS